MHQRLREDWYYPISYMESGFLRRTDLEITEPLYDYDSLSRQLISTSPIGTGSLSQHNTLTNGRDNRPRL